MSHTLSFIETTNAVSIILNDRWKSLSLATEQGKKLLAACMKPVQDIDEIAALADISLYITKHTFGRVSVDDHDQIRLDGRVVNYGLQGILVRMINEGANFGHLTKFLENVDENPDKSVADDLYSFLEFGKLPITPDGCFHAFKRVDKEFKSIRSGKEDCTTVNAEGNSVTQQGHIPHPVGSQVYMNREDCNPDRNQTCSRGLHACSVSYLDHYSDGGKIIIVKINPRDVTAIPNDYNNTKLRCCRLEVVAELPVEDTQTHFSSVVETRYTPEPEDADDQDYYDDEDPIEESEIDLAVAATQAVVLGARDGVDDAKNDNNDGEEFICDYSNGGDFYTINEAHIYLYALAYTEAYAEDFELGEYHSELAYERGEEDGADIAKEHLAFVAGAQSRLEDAFMPDAADGVAYVDIPDEHIDAYSKGYIESYVKTWKRG